MSNVIAISDLEKSKNNLSFLLKDLYIENNLSWNDFNNNNYDNDIFAHYKIIMFVINPCNVGNKIFIERLKELVKERLNTRSIYFVIDYRDELDKRELLRVKIEIEEAMKNIIDNPKVIDISSALASAYKMYTNKLCSLDFIRKNKDIFFIDNEGFPVSGSSIKEDDVLLFNDLSRIKILAESIKKDITDLVDINLSKVNWCVIGNSGSGKSTFIDNMQNINENIEYTEYLDISSLKLNVSEGIIIILDINHEENIAILKDVSERYLEEKKIVILNKADEFMYTEDDYKTFINKVRAYTKEILNEEIHIISSYNTKLWLELKKDTSKINEIRSDTKLVIFNKYYIPVIKFKNDKEFIEEFKKQNYLEELLEVEKICLNHLQK